MDPIAPASPEAPVVSHHLAEVNGIRIHYATAGRGEALLLLHGWPFTWYTWRLVLPVLARHYTVIMPDLRGIGQTSRPATGYDSRTRAADAAGLLHHLGFEQAYLVGHDLGVEVAFMTALEVAYYLDTYFKLDRRHSALGYRSPHQFETDLLNHLP